MEYNSIFDIIGPIMIGPSSSHTAGAVKIGKTARELFGGKPDKCIITLYGSFAKTHKGHGTDIAIIAGLLGFKLDDDRIRNSFTHAKNEDMDFSFIVSDKSVDDQNTADIDMKSAEGKHMFVRGVSVGGGKISITSIDGFKSALSGDNPTLLVFHDDEFGAIALVTGILAANKINVGKMSNARSGENKKALMLIETDSFIDAEVIGAIRQLPVIGEVIFVRNDTI